MRTRRTLILFGSIVTFTLALILPVVQVCRDWAFIDRNTGSRKGYRDWSLGWRTGSWYQTSALEVFMRTNYPTEFRQNWVSYAGTGRNIFGWATLRGHGRPGPILLLRPETITAYCEAASQTENRRLYNVFASGDEAKIRELVDQIIEASMTFGESEPGSAAIRPAECKQ